MFTISLKSVASRSLFAVVLLTTLACVMRDADAQQPTQHQAIGSQVSSTQPANANPALTEPLFRGYKGVTIGMSADEVRQKLGDPKEAGEKQDYFVFSDQESVQVSYDKDKKVRAVSLNYVGKDSGAPASLTVLGTEIEARKDGSIHKLVRYPDAGYWVSYSRTAGDAPLVTITMQKLRAAATKAAKQ